MRWSRPHCQREGGVLTLSETRQLMKKWKAGLYFPALKMLLLSAAVVHFNTELPSLAALRALLHRWETHQPRVKSQSSRKPAGVKVTRLFFEFWDFRGFFSPLFCQIKRFNVKVSTRASSLWSRESGVGCEGIKGGGGGGGGGSGTQACGTTVQILTFGCSSWTNLLHTRRSA